MRAMFRKEGSGHAGLTRMIEALSRMVSDLSMLVESMERSVEVYRDGMWAMFRGVRVMMMLDWCGWLRLSPGWWVVFPCWQSQRAAKGKLKGVDEIQMIRGTRKGRKEKGVEETWLAREKTGSGCAAAPWRRGGAITPLRKKILACGEGFESLVFWEREHDWQWKKWEMEVQSHLGEEEVQPHHWEKKFQHVERALKVWVSRRGGTIGSRKMGSGDVVVPLRREGAGAPLRKKF